MKIVHLIGFIVLSFSLAGCATKTNRVALQQPGSASLKPSQFAQPTSDPQTDYNNVDLVALQQQRGLSPGSQSRGSQRSRSRPTSGSS